ncbi:hypothetical protein FB45DRAFT_923332 [Roridomyces roridus]|uniref:DUF6535 domain-containing protein n=1 Tax=Roridomyces roridus TaxID=1738132 RepID=A0AAD7BL05_9AGAR|nr:hypothetical protein FB45DRAFT_923332 [Roridomyces roridus]
MELVDLYRARLYQAIHGLQSKASNTDKKTTFWNNYNGMATEHDKDFHRRYATDLDMSLIFAGLFSAVDSAFIIQIQPDIKFHGTPPTVLVAQSLLYVSLGSTLLAALLSVLGKQWLMYYAAAGSSGTMAARGLERQRKLDGRQRWKFDSILQLFPLLLQLAVLLFTAALSVYLWKINLILAILVMTFTTFGCLVYLVLLLSAVIDPDSPFQTPPAKWIAKLIPTTGLMKTMKFAGGVPGHFVRFIGRIWARCWPRRPVQPQLPRVRPSSPQPAEGSTISRIIRSLPEPIQWMLYYIHGIFGFFQNILRCVFDTLHVGHLLRFIGQAWTRCWPEKAQLPTFGPADPQPTGGASPIHIIDNGPVIPQVPLTTRIIQRLPMPLRRVLSFVFFRRRRRRSVAVTSSRATHVISSPTQSFPTPGHKPPTPTRFVESFPKASPETSAVSWVLETSTDPSLISSAAEVAVGMQWPLSSKLELALGRLRDTLLGLFEYRTVYQLIDDGPVKTIHLDRIRDGMGDSVIRCGLAYVLLDAVSNPVAALSRTEVTRFACTDYRQFDTPVVANIVRVLTGSNELDFSSNNIMENKWALRAYIAVEPDLLNRPSEINQFLDRTKHIARLDISGFTEYLFCIAAFLNRAVDMRDLLVMDKSMLQEQSSKTSSRP